MKKVIALILALALSASLVACSSSSDSSSKAAESSETSEESSTVSEEESEEVSEEVPEESTEEVSEEESTEEDSEGVSSEEAADKDADLAGGWTVSEDGKVTDDAKNALEKALEAYTGMEFEAKALLGTQIVAGTNYKLLCIGTTVTAEPESAWKVVTVYADLDGNAEITDVYDFEDFDKDLTGAYALNEEALTSEDSDRMEKALEGLTGADYEPVVLLATQVVSGTNYKYLCLETTVTANPVSSWAVVTVYEDLDGSCSIEGDIENIDLAALSSAE